MFEVGDQVSEEVAVYGCNGMTSQEKKRWLRRYREHDVEIKQIDIQIDDLVSEIDVLRSMAEKTTTSLTGMPTGKGGKSREDTYDKMIDLSAEIDGKVDLFVNKKREVYAKRKEIENALNKMDDPVLKQLLIERYVNGKTFEQIAVDMAYCIRQIWRLHGTALEVFRIPI